MKPIDLVRHKMLSLRVKSSILYFSFIILPAVTALMATAMVTTALVTTALVTTELTFITIYSSLLVAVMVTETGSYNTKGHTIFSSHFEPNFLSNIQLRLLYYSLI